MARLVTNGLRLVWVTRQHDILPTHARPLPCISTISLQDIISFETDLAHHLPPNHAELVHHNDSRSSQTPQLLQKVRVVPVRLRTAVVTTQSKGPVRCHCPILHLKRRRASWRHQHRGVLHRLLHYGFPRTLEDGTRFTPTQLRNAPHRPRLARTRRPSHDHA